MNPDKPASGLDIMLQRSLLLRIGENIICGREENENFVLSEIRISKESRILGCIHGEIVCAGQGLDSLDPVGDGRMAKTGSIGVNEDFERGCREESRRS